MKMPKNQIGFRIKHKQIGKLLLPSNEKTKISDVKIIVIGRIP
jgi:hypothetical protein